MKSEVNDGLVLVSDFSTESVVLIDIDNTWELLYSIIIKNEFMYNQIKPGGKIIIEGGSNAHPRINRSTLNQFHNKLGKKVFDFEHISGPRTSLSKLKLL